MGNGTEVYIFSKSTAWILIYCHWPLQSVDLDVGKVAIDALCCYVKICQKHLSNRNYFFLLNAIVCDWWSGQKNRSSFSLSPVKDVFNIWLTTAPWQIHSFFLASPSVLHWSVNQRICLINIDFSGSVHKEQFICIIILLMVKALLARSGRNWLKSNHYIIDATHCNCLGPVFGQSRGIKRFNNNKPINKCNDAHLPNVSNIWLVTWYLCVMIIRKESMTAVINISPLWGIMCKISNCTVHLYASMAAFVIVNEQFRLSFWYLHHVKIIREYVIR